MHIVLPSFSGTGIYLSMLHLSNVKIEFSYTCWRHRMEAFFVLLDLCYGNPSVTGECPSKRPVTRCFDVFFDLHLNKRLSKQSRRRWFETPVRSLWRQCNDILNYWSHDMNRPLYVMVMFTDVLAHNRSHAISNLHAVSTGTRDHINKLEYINSHQ